MGKSNFWGKIKVIFGEKVIPGDLYYVIFGEKVTVGEKVMGGDKK